MIYFTDRLYIENIPSGIALIRQNGFAPGQPRRRHDPGEIPLVFRRVRQSDDPYRRVDFVGRFD